MTAFGRSALVMAHPGHELCVYGWAAKARPQIHVLTDGSGSRGASRIASAIALATDLRATCGEIFPAGTDRDLYQAILSGDAQRFIALAERLANSFAAGGIEFVCADAAEGFSPAHDVCRAVVDLAVTLAERSMGKPIANYQFLLSETDSGAAAANESDGLHYCLDDEAFAGKLRAAHDYAGLSEEESWALARFGPDHFRNEHLYPVTERFRLFDGNEAPHYETVGEARVTAGDYASIIRRDRHVNPIVLALRKRSEETRTPNA